MKFLQKITCLHLCALLVPALLTLSGCETKTESSRTAGNSLRNEITTVTTPLIENLIEPLAKRDRKGTRAVLRRAVSEIKEHPNFKSFSFAVLENHGITVAGRSEAETSGIQNYGNYKIVSRVLESKTTQQSTLYLQNGDKLFIICIPLKKESRLVGVLIVGMGSDKLRKSGVSEEEFQAIDFSPETGGGR
jgi:hypothetical protein